jgi:hypothetical protein
MGVTRITGVQVLDASIEIADLSATGTPSSSTFLRGDNTWNAPSVGNLTGLGTGIATFLGTPSSANLLAAITDETGTGSLVFSTSPTLTTPIATKLNVGVPQSTWPFEATALTGTGTASQSGTTITGTGFTADILGSYFVFANGTIRKITAFTNSTTITAHASGTVASQGYTTYAAGIRISTVGDIVMGTSDDLPSGARAFLMGGSNGANFDIRARIGGTDQAIIELQNADFDSTFKSTYLYNGGTSATGTTFGITNANLGALVFQDKTNIAIGSITAVPIIFTSNNTEKMRMSASGDLTLSGSAGLTGTRISKGWFTNLEITNAPTLNGVAANGSGAFVLTTSPVLVTPTLGVATVTSINTHSLPAGTTTLAGLNTTQTFTGINTFSPTARTSGAASYFTITTPTDTGITATTESIGVNFTAATRTWADGTTTLQRERVFAAPTYNKTTTSATFTTAVNVDIADPVAGAGVTITNNYGLRAANVLFTGVIKVGSTPTTLTDSAGKVLSSALNTVAVDQGGTGRTTSTTAYGLIAAGTTATGAHQTLSAGATTEILVGGGASALPVWTTATGSGAPVRAVSPTFTGTVATAKIGVLAVSSPPYDLTVGGLASAERTLGMLRFDGGAGARYGLSIQNKDNTANTTATDRVEFGVAHNGEPASNVVMSLFSNGNVKIGGVVSRGTTEGSNQLVIFNGTAPVGTLTNGASFYAASGEMRVMDSGGTSTLLSPHDEENYWVFDSEDTLTGETLHIDVEKLLRFVNDYFGLDFVKGNMTKSVNN